MLLSWYCLLASLYCYSTFTRNFMIALACNFIWGLNVYASTDTKLTFFINLRHSSMWRTNSTTSHSCTTLILRFIWCTCGSAQLVLTICICALSSGPILVSLPPSVLGRYDSSLWVFSFSSEICDSRVLR